MPTYKCTNKDCEAFGKEIHVSSARIIVDKQSIFDKSAPCPYCMLYRETVKPDGFTTQIHGGKNIPIS